MFRSIAKLVLLLSMFSLVACAGAKPWERGELAKYEMAFEPDPLEAKMKGHIYHSKEASSAGASAAGGGCGCN